MADYLFIIYTHKGNLHKARVLYNFVKPRLVANCKCYMMYGIHELETAYKIINDEILIIRCQDGYEYLNYKSIILFEVVNIAFPNIKGIIKCDDDIIINMQNINNFLTNSALNVDYCGGKIHNVTKPKYSGYHIPKVNNNKYKKPMHIPVVKYCGGPMYYLSSKALKIFTQKNLYNNFFEDIMVGKNMNNHGIFPSKYICLWTENINNLHNVSYHNYNHKNLDNRHI